MKRDDHKRRIYCLQFHPEVVHTPEGTTLLRNFVYDICGCKPTWTMQSYVDTAVKQIREQVGKERVICALSGGVDSSVAAALTHRAIGDRLPVFLWTMDCFGAERKNKSNRLLPLNSI